MNTYTWEIESLDCLPDGKVVFCIHWRLKGISNKGVSTVSEDSLIKVIPFESEVYGIQIIEQDTKTDFIEYESLSKDVVLGWAKKAMGEDEIVKLQKQLDKQLEALANPTVIVPPLPWAE